MFVILLNQGFPNWGTCTSGDTFAYHGVHLLYSHNKLTLKHKMVSTFIGQKSKRSIKTSVDFCYFTPPFCRKKF